MSAIHSNIGTAAPTADEGGWPPLRLAFRPLFLLASITGVVCLGLWVAQVSGLLLITPYGGPLWWHIHEMLFGFVAAVIAGFLLTAVQNWTGVPGIRGLGLGVLVALWLAARLGLYIGSPIPGLVLLFVDIAFLPLVAALMARSVIRVRQWRNIIFVPVLLLMALANGLMHWGVITADPGWLTGASEAMVLLVTLLMTVVGGRVIPLFTASGTGTPRVADLPWLERASIISMVLAITAAVAAPLLSGSVVVGLVLVAALVQGCRVLRWRSWCTLGTPLVWSLHLSYWCIPLGLLLYALALLTPTISHSQAIHTLTVGAMGLMILAMISRVSLGHTGRAIQVGRLMAAAFAALFIAFLVRVGGVALGLDYILAIQLSACLWGLAFTTFAVRYFPVLTRPRVDGRPG